MAEEFLNNRADIPAVSGSTREPVRILVLGSRQGITNIIHTLYAKQFAEIHEWSEPLPEPNSGKLVSVITKYLAVD